MIRRVRLVVAADAAGRRLDAVVGAWLASALERPLSKATVRTLIMAGAVRLDGRPVRRAGLVLQAGSVLEAHVDLARLGHSRAGLPANTSPAIAVLYQDDYLIAVAKPAGLLTHAAADRARTDLFTEVRRLLSTGLKPCAATDAPLPYLGLHHRLDVETSGVVLFTRQPRANAALAAQFAGRDVEKVYHAIARRPRAAIPSRWRVENRLATEGTGRRARVTAVREGGADASTGFTVLETLRAAVLVEARPETGRKHQVRAHLAGRQMPVLGDARYGGPDQAGGIPVPRVMLHAARLAFTHPITAQRVTIECPYPEDFAELLRRLAPAVRTPPR